MSYSGSRPAIRSFTHLAPSLLGTIGALFVAILLNQKLPGTTMLRVVYYMPSIASGVAISILWIWLFNPQVGLVNYLLGLVGIDGPLWLASQQWALPALIIKSAWGIGANMIIILAGLAGHSRVTL